MTSSEESISALVDGECTPEELDVVLHACSQQPGLLRLCSRHWAVSELRRGHRLHDDSEQLCAAVMGRLDAPSSALPIRSRRLRYKQPRRRYRWRAAGGLALAASFGAVVALTSYRLAVPMGAVGGPPQVVADRAADLPLADGSTRFAGAVPLAQTVRWSRIDPQSVAGLNDYLMSQRQSYSFARTTEPDAYVYVPGITSDVRYSPVEKLSH